MKMTSPFEKYFTYLDDLRSSGLTNMFGAAPFLEQEFGLGKRQARDILQRWMQSYDRDTPAAERAAKIKEGK
jgi:hypothetical protein